MLEEIDMERFRDEAVGIATGGTSLERDISLKTGRAFEKALRSRGYDVTVYDIADDLEKVISDGPSAMLLGIHGGRGESGALQGFLECAQIPYTGSGVQASALAMDKRRARIVCQSAQVPVADAVWIDSKELGHISACAGRVEAELTFPVVAKLNDGGSSVGVHLCRDASQLREALESLEKRVTDAPLSGVLVERCVDGPEYTVGFFGTESLGVIEVEPAETFYDYKSKYESQETAYKVIEDDSICEPLVNWAARALDALGCRGVARVDFKGDVDEAVMLEVNTIPGMTATSLVPKLAAHRGMAFEDFVEAMLATADLKSK